ncbi:MAG TPA: Mur ligase family protein [Bacteroidales bacterium]|nr:Mur ligase family protein [Bacteroidales bacterium]HPS16974.1 Mur ligase family protein [Bacteroidales bacterium]
MDYRQTLDYLYEQLPMFHRVGAAAYKADLNNTIAISELLKKPHLSFKSIHIAGTNGKGSVSHFLASIMQECGFKTGLYTSPHLKDFRERIKINGQMISEKYVVDFVEHYKTEFEKIKPSFFEWTVGLAFDYFRNEKVEIAIIETGLGGRLDSTNIITPEVSVITNISWDHSNLLGDTLEKIAIEKAGIIKENIPVIIGETQEHSGKIFLAKAKEKKSEIFFADKHFEVKNILQKFEMQPLLELMLQPLDNSICSVFFKNDFKIVSELTGNYQTKNIITVCTVVDVLNKLGYDLKQKNILDGFAKVVRNTGILGRWQKLSDNPLTFCDTGHNVDGINEVLKQLQKISYHKLHIVFGVVNDKDIHKILPLLPENAMYYFCKASVPRALDDNELLTEAKKYNLNGTAYGSVQNAYKAAQSHATKNDLIYIGGSTFVVADIIC